VSIRGNIASLREFSAALSGMSRVLAQKVAIAAAPALTAAARATFNAGENSYGTTWDPLADGSRATLQKSGALARGITYRAVGRLLRVVLTVPYAKYNMGKRPAFPPQGAPLPQSYVDALTKSAHATIRAELGR
jgi:hypothetical protein